MNFLSGLQKDSLKLYSRNVENKIKNKHKIFI